LMVDALRELFSAVGRAIDDYLDLVRLPFNYRIRFGDGSLLDVSNDQAAMRRQLDAFEPGAGEAYLRYLEDAGQKYRVSRRRFTDRNFRSWAAFLTPINLYYLLRVQALHRLAPFAARYFTDPRLRIAFTFQTMYLGLSPADAPAIYSLLPYTELLDGIWYPMGGMYSIPLALARLLEDLGGEIRLQCPVEEVAVRQRRATGVRLTDGSTLRADVVVCNADLPHSYRTLVPPGFRKPYEHDRLDRLRYGCSAFMLYLGVDTVYDQLFHHNVFLSARPEHNFDQIFKQGRLPDDPSFYVHCAARTDPAMAPSGCDTVYILVPVPPLTGGVDWQVEGPRFRERVLERVEAVAAPRIREHIVVERMITPVDWARGYNLRHGATFGLSHDLLQVGYLRPRNKAAALDRLYFVGASTVPGGGVPMVFIGSRLVAERIAQEVARA
ncbi:MAG TPA: phytoene desaturase family protein, partial [Chloroflexota bacterium]|nr:phytoene desaturase family protein [Chloroflexota bacterium]